MRLVAVRIAWARLPSSARRGGGIRLRTGQPAPSRLRACRVDSGASGLLLQTPEVIRVDPEQAAERAFVGGVVGGPAWRGCRCYVAAA